MVKPIIYSTPTCGYCVMLKNFLKEKGIEYEDIDVSADQEKAQYMIGKTGQMGVPQTEIGDTWIIGFNKQKIMDALGIKE